MSPPPDEGRRGRAHATRGRGRLALSGIVAASIAGAALAHVVRATDHFDRMTFESLREARVARAEMAAGAVDVTLTDGSRRALWGPSHGPAGTDAPRAFLVDFVYARCASVCQALGGDFRQMSDALRADASGARVRLVSLSIDPGEEPIAELAAYARAHRADPAQWWVGRADPARTRQLLRDLAIIAIPDGQGGFVHNGDIHLVDATGRVRGLFAYDDWPRALAAARRLAGAAP